MYNRSMNKVSQEKHVTLNRPAMWSALPNTNIGSRKYSSNLVYIDNSQIKVATPEHPVTAYYQTFTKAKNDFALFIYSDEEDSEKVAKYFKKLVTKIKAEDIVKSLATSSSDGFTYLEETYKGENK